ncbi:hypothetical protein HanLR1_Chr03g0114901 [Helianthus annuus]|nr:hypothetical protein HanLR1_Chr03g0114901 [Helianthus annuus]
MASVAHLHHSPLSGNNLHHSRIPDLQLPTFTCKNLVGFTALPLRFKPIDILSIRQPIPCTGGGGGSAGVGNGSCGRRGGNMDQQPSVSYSPIRQTSNMFEPVAYSAVNRLGTFVYKGILFAAVGFAAGLVWTALSNGLIKIRKKMDPGFESPNKAPPTVLNAVTWAIHMGLSANLRYQSLNGIEFLLAKGLPSLLFKSSVFGLRLANNVLGGMTFVMLARVTGSQSVA